MEQAGTHAGTEGSTLLQKRKSECLLPPSAFFLLLAAFMCVAVFAFTALKSKP